MRIVGLVKQIYDPAEIRPSLQGPELKLEGVPRIVNPFDEFGIEECLQWKEKLGGEVVIITMGDENAPEVLRTALAMGVDAVYHVMDPAFVGADTYVTSHALAKAIEKIGGADLIIAGKIALGGDTAHVGSQVAAWLDIPVITYVSKVNEFVPADKKIVAERLLEGGKEIVSSTLPCVITVMKDINKPRYPSLMGLRKAAKVQIPVFSKADLGIGDDILALEAMVKVTPPPARPAGEMLNGSTEEMVNQLLEKLFAQKVF
jgi:electron transfer flavoprotein beta subunit